MAQLSELISAWPVIVEDLDLLAVALVALTARAIFDLAADLSLLQWRMLSELEAAGSLRIGDLSQRLPSSMPGTSRLVKRMTQRGLVECYPVPADGRGIRVQLSPKGRTLHTTVVDRRRDLILGGLVSLPASDRLHGDLATIGKRLRASFLAPVDAGS